MLIMQNVLATQCQLPPPVLLLRRRVLVPPEAGYVSSVLLPQPPTYATKRQLANHSSEPLLFEVQLLRVLPGTAT